MKPRVENIRTITRSDRANRCFWQYSDALLEAAGVFLEEHMQVSFVLFALSLLAQSQGSLMSVSLSDCDGRLDR